MEEDDKGCPMIRMGVSGWMFLSVLAYPGSSGQKAVKLLCVCVCVYLYGEWWCISPSIYLAAVALYFELLLVHSFNGLFFRTTWAGQYQKGKTSLDLNEARDDGVLGCSGISRTICTQSAPHSRQFTTPTPPLFLQVGCSAWCLTNNVKALKHNTNGHTVF